MSAVRTERKQALRENAATIRRIEANFREWEGVGTLKEWLGAVEIEGHYTKPLTPEALEDGHEFHGVFTDLEATNLIAVLHRDRTTSPATFRLYPAF